MNLRCHLNADCEHEVDPGSVSAYREGCETVLVLRCIYCGLGGRLSPDGGLTWSQPDFEYHKEMNHERRV